MMIDRNEKGETIMNLKKGICLLLAGALGTGTILSGCSRKDSTEDAVSAKGGYIEEEMEAPWQEGEYYMGSFFNQEGNLEVYTGGTSDSGTAQVFSYTYTGGGNWDQQEEVWAENLLGTDQTSYNLIQGEDQNLYLLALKNSTEDSASEEEETESEEVDIEDLIQEWHLYRYGGEGEAQEIYPECLSEENQREAGGFFPYYFGVNQEGNPAFMSMGSEIALYNGETGKEQHTFPAYTLMNTSDKMADINGNTLAVLGNEDQDLVLYDTQTGEETGTIDFGNQDRGQLCAVGEGTYYLANPKGIFVYKEDGSIVEQIYDAGRGIMGETAGGLVINHFLAGENEDFYALYTDYETQELSICYYYYNGSVTSEVENELSVYSLYESAMIEDAVRKYEREHPETEVTYEYAVESDGSGNPEDAIDTLNTQLLNKEGPDLLLLDDLPVESYIKRGVLEDLTEDVQQLVSDGTILENVVKGTEVDGKNYELPAVFSLPIYYGTQDAIDRMDSLDSLADYIKGNSNGKVLGTVSLEQIAYMLFAANYQDIQKDGVFAQEALVQILDTAKALWDANPSEAMEEAWVTGYSSQIKSGKGISAFGAIGMDELYDDTHITGVDDVTGISSTAMMFDILTKHQEMTIENVKNMYIPANRMGINSSSQKKDLAKDFMETVLSDEIQVGDYLEGLPVRTESLEKLPQISEASDMTMANSYDGGPVREYGMPSADQIQQIVDMAKQADTPLLIDRTVRNTFLECAENYAGGDVSAQEAAQDMADKMELYLAE